MYPEFQTQRTSQAVPVPEIHNQNQAPNNHREHLRFLRPSLL